MISANHGIRKVLVMTGDYMISANHGISQEDMFLDFLPLDHHFGKMSVGSSIPQLAMKRKSATVSA